MKKQITLIASLFFLSIGMAHAQQVKIKKDIVYLDKEPSFQVVTAP